MDLTVIKPTKRKGMVRKPSPFRFLLGVFVVKVYALTGAIQMNSMLPTKANAAQIMRTLSCCVSLMVTSLQLTS